ncbi:hypothetical protein [Dyadobacter sp. 3J3]|uniref:hypothetical protein n=1 Tax=Dyadobacter sp. 3J3 TaxID=2606600 RepID=UPI00135B88F8|nr:hypothetical protein [Dyadobacter sp. 3J3]
MLSILLGSCGGPKTYSEKRAVKIEGKPVIITYQYHINAGRLLYKYKGFLDGKVGVGYFSDCENRSDAYLIKECVPIDHLHGNLSKIKPNATGEEAMNAGETRCLVLIPENKDTIGEFTIEFSEDQLGSW